jgi:NAD(P)-dependent dehydrogenase (short-subunit alcohol dehydrogenase family)
VAAPGRVALVTGASRGIGAATAERLRLDGWRVETAERASGIDLSEPGAGAAVVEQLDRIDALVCNAGTAVRKGFLETTREDYDRVVDLNVASVFELAQAAARRMVDEGGGSIVLLASMMSFRAASTSRPTPHRRERWPSSRRRSRTSSRGEASASTRSRPGTSRRR